MPNVWHNKALEAGVPASRLPRRGRLPERLVVPNEHPNPAPQT